jgi:hypothetical protein
MEHSLSRQRGIVGSRAGEDVSGKGTGGIMAKFEAKLVGIAPLLMHSCRLLDKMTPQAKEKAAVTKKKAKTDDDMLTIKRLEWYAGLYTDEKGQVAIPADNILATIIEGAKKSKLGKQAQAAVFETDGYYPLIYQGPKDLAALYADGRFCDYRGVRNQQNRVMRSRPIFRDWACKISLMFNETVLDPAQLKQALVAAGELVGLGDWRPRFGRFIVE